MKKVLIVEDDVMLSEIYKKKFENSGKFEVFLATSGTDAIEKSKKIIPDLILWIWFYLRWMVLRL
jgi:DNA-binding response OmpR family regulator